MTTSGTTLFNPDMGELIEEAFERAGLEARSGYHIKTARRSLNFLMAEFANKGLNLWTVKQATMALTPGVAEYALPTDCVDLIEHVCRSSVNNQNIDITLDRISVSTYAQIPNKSTPGRPYQIYVDRQIAPKATVWPVPDITGYTLVYWYMRRLEDAGSAVSTSMDIPFRFYNALVSGLAYHIALKNPEASDRIQMLKELYDEAFALAAEEDRDRASVRLVPFASYGV